MIAKSGGYRTFVIALAGILVWTLSYVSPAVSQGRYGALSRLEAGTTIPVRTTEDIKTNHADGEVYRGVVDNDVLDNRGNVAIPRGSDVEMVVRQSSNNQLVLDLDSVSINGRRYGLETDETTVNSQRKEGIGANERTAKYVGGGALLGAVIGAIAGGGKGAAIGAGAGAAAGAGTQILTRGSHVNVPEETLLTFRLQEPLRTAFDSGYSYQGRHYHRGYDYDRDGQYSTSRNNYGQGNIRVGRDNRVSWWNAPDRSRVYVSTDNSRPRLFAEGASGNQDAPWITPGHRYVFVLRDPNGNEIGRDEVDLRAE